MIFGNGGLKMVAAQNYGLPNIVVPRRDNMLGGCNYSNGKIKLFVVSLSKTPA